MPTSKACIWKRQFSCEEEEDEKEEAAIRRSQFCKLSNIFCGTKNSKFHFWTNDNFFQQYLQFFLPFVNPKKLRTIFLSKMKRKKIKSIFRTKTFIAALSNSETHHFLEKPNRKLGRLIKYKKKSNSFFEKDLPRSLFVYFRSFQTHILTEKSVSVSQIRTWIVRVEGEHVYHLTTTTAVVGFYWQCTWIQNY